MANLIDKDALVAEIKRRKELVSDPILLGNDLMIGERNAYFNLLSFIDTLEVKEVDLDFQRFAKEMDAIFALPSSETKNTKEEPLNWEYTIAKHFFELGLKAEKGEEI